MTKSTTSNALTTLYKKKTVSKIQPESRRIFKTHKGKCFISSSFSGEEGFVSVRAATVVSTDHPAAGGIICLHLSLICVIMSPQWCLFRRALWAIALRSPTTVYKVLSGLQITVHGETSTDQLNVKLKHEVLLFLVGDPGFLRQGITGKRRGHQPIILGIFPKTV